MALPPNGFQDRPVMTTSVPLRIMKRKIILSIFAAHVNISEIIDKFCLNEADLCKYSVDVFDKYDDTYDV